MNLRSLTLAVAGLALLVTFLAPSAPVRAGHDTAGTDSAAAAAESAPIPAGEEGRLIAYGRDILTKTQTLLPADVSEDVLRGLPQQCWPETACGIAAGGVREIPAVEQARAPVHHVAGQARRMLSLQHERPAT